MHRVVEAVRAKAGPSKEICICYEDQPNGDFKSLFFHTQGIRPVEGVKGGVDPLTKHPGVFVVASGTSFFQQAFPSSSVDLSVSFTAMHWLSKLPCTISTGIHSTQATGTEKAKFKEQAARDFESILLSRARELRPGGHLVIANFAEDPRGWWLGKTDIGPGMYDTMDRLWRGMAEEGLISKEEYERTTFCNHYRTEEEAVGAFAEGGAVHNAGLRLLHHSFVVTPCPFREAYRANKGDPAAHAKWMIPTFRTWSNSTFESALDSSRSPDQRRALSDELFKRMEAEAAKDPENFGMDYVHSFMLIKKVQE